MRAPRVHLPARRGALLTAAATALATVAVAISGAAASADTAGTSVPAAGATVTCNRTGALTGVSGSLDERETTTVDRQGRARVLFTIATDHVQLAGPDGRRYQLIGAGYDDVLYPTATTSGPVQHEREQFRFIVLRRQRAVGAVHFDLSTGPDQIPHVNDTSTCQLPNMG